MARVTATEGVGDVCWIFGEVIGGLSGGVFAGKENAQNFPGKCKPDDEFGGVL